MNLTPFGLTNLEKAFLLQARKTFLVSLPTPMTKNRISFWIKVSLSLVNARKENHTVAGNWNKENEEKEEWMWQIMTGI